MLCWAPCCLSLTSQAQMLTLHYLCPRCGSFTCCACPQHLCLAEVPRHRCWTFARQHCAWLQDNYMSCASCDWHLRLRDNAFAECMRNR